MYPRTTLGFTLIQLVVALAVLAILVVMIIPMVQKGVESARATACLSNLRHFGSAFLQHVSENGNIPPYKEWWPQEDGTEKGGAVWYNRLAVYLPGGNTAEGNWVHTCPSAEVKYRRSPSGLTMYGWANYGYNAGVGETPAASVTEYTDLSTLMIMADGNATEGLSAPASWIIQGIPRSMDELLDRNLRNNFSFRHMGKTQILFADGHTEARTPEETPLFRPLTPESNRFWKGR